MRPKVKDVVRGKKRVTQIERAFQTHVYLSAAEAQAIQTLADAECRSVTQQIRWMILEQLLLLELKKPSSNDG